MAYLREIGWQRRRTIGDEQWFRGTTFKNYFPKIVKKKKMYHKRNPNKDFLAGQQTVAMEKGQPRMVKVHIGGEEVERS